MFENSNKALYQDAAHAYDDASVLMLSKRGTSVLTSQMIPVTQHEQVHLQSYLHYTKLGARTWQKIGASAAGLAIGSLPYLLDRRGNEGTYYSPGFQKAAPLMGAAVASLPFLLEQKRKRRGSRAFKYSLKRNGLFVPNAYVRYTLYNQERHIVKSGYQMINREAKEGWQKVELIIDIPEDGYLSLELGNQSKRPVWVDGLHYETKRRHIKHTDLEGNNHIINIPVDISNADIKTEMFDNVISSNGKANNGECGGYYDCYEICVGPGISQVCNQQCDFVPFPCPDDPPGGIGVPGGTGNGDEDGDGDGDSISKLNVSSLNSVQVESLENVLETMEENCFYKSMLKGLTTEPNVKMNKKNSLFPSSFFAPGSYSPITNTISFRSNGDINLPTAAAEIFHARQQQHSGLLYNFLSKKGLSNVEFEEKFMAAVAAGIEYYQNVPPNFSYGTFPGMEGVFDWVLDIIVANNGVFVTSFDSAMQAQYGVFLRAFQAYHSNPFNRNRTPSYGSPLDTAPSRMSPNTTFDILKSSDCKPL